MAIPALTAEGFRKRVDATYQAAEEAAREGGELGDAAGKQLRYVHELGECVKLLAGAVEELQEEGRTLRTQLHKGYVLTADGGVPKRVHDLLRKADQGRLEKL
jgi:hypothetical protein